MKKLIVVLSVLLFATWATAEDRWVISDPNPGATHYNMFHNPADGEPELVAENEPAEEDGSVLFDMWTLDEFGDKLYKLTATAMKNEGGRQSGHSNLLPYDHQTPPAAPTGLRSSGSLEE